MVFKMKMYCDISMTLSFRESVKSSSIIILSFQLLQLQWRKHIRKMWPKRFSSNLKLKGKCSVKKIRSCEIYLYINIYCIHYECETNTKG